MEQNKDHIEELILLYIDGELEKGALEPFIDFIRNKPDLQRLLESYAVTKLTAEEGMQFPDKDMLLRTESKVLPFYRGKVFIRTAAAILIIGLAGLGFLWKVGKGIPSSPPEIAVRKSQPVIPGPESVDPAALIPRAELRHSPKEQDPRHPGGRRQVAQLKEPADTGTGKGQLRNLPRQKQLIAEPAMPVLVQRLPSEQDYIPDAGVEKIVMSSEQALARGPGKKTVLALPDWLPVEQGRLQGLNDLVNQVQLTKDKIAERVAGLRHSILVFHIGNREITLGQGTKL